ncbi:MAG: CDP-alcohol phosphatidyltransferase family protein [Candidatus Omnitrophica bacterium]|nr:CDP-alcohol phosphatidyltransferase family protein [Candidatus Omnitrophota bacterium]
MNIANKISTFRILSVPFFIAALTYYTPQQDYLRWVALAIFVVAAVSDAVDGYIARKSKLISKAGMVLDPLGDKLLLVSAFICLNLVKSFPNGIYIPLWVTLIVISRDILIMLGTIVIFIVKQEIKVYPTRWGKLTTSFQMAAVGCVLLQLKVSPAFWWMAAIFTLISGVDYVMRGFKVLYAIDNNRNHN